jgi:murein DD-endopeptidase MepM/ murein hydrolase activator NlpD
MNQRIACLPIFVGLLVAMSSASHTQAAGAPQVPIPGGVTRVLQGFPPNFSGGGPIEGPKDFMSDAQRAAIEKELDANRLRLSLEGKLAPTAVDAHPLYGWPLRLAAGLTDPGYHGIYNFVDLDPRYPGFLLDYNCGTRSYDTDAGYNHSGTDFGLWPWPWDKMDGNQVEVVAAAPGQIVYKSDGNYDRSCSMNGNQWNAIFVQHADGSTAWYGHMKSGSLTSKVVGDSVVEGEFLGVVGSSGNSTGPHLHFETHDANNFLIEPWAGPCNNLNADSWWKTQRPYYDSAIDRLTTGDTPANFGACPVDETTGAAVTFSVGPTVYFTAYYRDQLGTQPALYTVYRPDGSIYSQWTHTSPAPFYATSWWYWGLSIPAGEMQGAWNFTVQFESVTYERPFSIGSPAGCGSLPESTVQGDLLHIDKNSSLIRLTWGTSCNPGDTDYVLYDGAIGSYYSHSRIACSTGGNHTALISPAAGSRYYLVAPRNATREGSLGRASSGAERPPGTISCYARLQIACP